MLRYSLSLIMPTLFLSFFINLALVHNLPSKEQREEIFNKLQADFEALDIFNREQTTTWNQNFIQAKKQAMSASKASDIQEALDLLSQPWSTYTCTDRTMGESLNPYPGYNQLMMNEGFNIHLPEDLNEKTLLIQWKDFGEHYHEPLEAFIRFARSNKFLDHKVILDLRYAKGTAPSSYLMHKLFGNNFKHSQMMISDSKQSLNYFQKQKSKEGKLITQKLLKKNKNSLAILSNIFGKDEARQAAFRGKKVILMGPDQGPAAHEMISMVIENDLAPTVGISTKAMGFRHLNTVDVFKGLQFTWPLMQVKNAKGQMLHDQLLKAEEYFEYTDPADYEILDRALELID